MDYPFMKIEEIGRSDVPILPEEIIEEEILSRLEVKSLLRLRCVSKSYRSLIDSKRFIKIHHQKATTLAYERHRVLFLSNIYSPKVKAWGCSLLSFIDASFLYKPLHFPTNIPHRAIHYVGCCNGLVCIMLCAKNSPFILWNPSTRISKKLPHIDDTFSKILVRSDFICYGFGWDESSDDYKVITVVRLDESQSIRHIYSLKSDSWKKIDGNWDYNSRRCRWYVPIGEGVLTAGKLHWERLYRDNINRRWEIVAFDVKREVFEIVGQPYLNPNYVSPAMGTFGECLSMHFAYKDFKEVWVMKEYGVQESWEKILFLDEFDEDNTWTWTAHSPAASFNGGKGGIMLMNTRYDTTYLAYDPKTNSIYCPDISGEEEIVFHFEVYVESLVSPLH